MNTIALKIVVDTNILLAVVPKKSPYRWIFDCIIDGKLILCISNEILFEYHEILEQKLSAEIAENITNFITISPFVEKSEIFYNFNLIAADADDNKFVDCAIAANAVCLVSNDNHFQVLKKIDFPPVTILTLPEFEAEYKQQLTEQK